MMKLYAPNKYTYWTGIAFALLGLIGDLVTIDFLTARSTTFLYIGLLVLALGPLNKMSGSK